MNASISYRFNPLCGDGDGQDVDDGDDDDSGDDNDVIDEKNVSEDNDNGHSSCVRKERSGNAGTSFDPPPP